MDRKKLVEFAQKWAAATGEPYDYYSESKTAYYLTTKKHLDSGFACYGGYSSIIIDKETGEMLYDVDYFLGSSEEDTRVIREGLIADIED